MRYFAFLAALILLAGCAYQRPTAISQPPVAGKTRIIPVSPDRQVWRPDATRVIFRNYSLTLTIEVWLDRQPAGEPDLRLLPETAWPANFSDLGRRFVYLRGWEVSTADGRREVGVKKLEFFIARGAAVYSPGEIFVGDGDFDSFLYNSAARR